MSIDWLIDKSRTLFREGKWVCNNYDNRPNWRREFWKNIARNVFCNFIYNAMWQERGVKGKKQSYCVERGTNQKKVRLNVEPISRTNFQYIKNETELYKFLYELNVCYLLWLFFTLFDCHQRRGHPFGNNAKRRLWRANTGSRSPEDRSWARSNRGSTDPTANTRTGAPTFGGHPKCRQFGEVHSRRAKEALIQKDGSRFG